MNRDSIIKGLAVFAAIVLVLFIGFVNVKILLNISQKDMKIDTTESVTLDANNALKGTIDSLETSWQNVQAYQFRVGQDPLHLGRVIKDFAYSKEGFKETEEEDRIRLTATVIDDNPKAIIKYKGKSYVVTVGELIDQTFRVISITNRQVVLESGGARTVLTSKPVQGLDETGANQNSPTARIWKLVTINLYIAVF